MGEAMETPSRASNVIYHEDEEPWVTSMQWW